MPFVMMAAVNTVKFVMLVAVRLTRRDVPVPVAKAVVAVHVRSAGIRPVVQVAAALAQKTEARERYRESPVIHLAFVIRGTFVPLSLRDSPPKPR